MEAKRKTERLIKGPLFGVLTTCIPQKLGDCDNQKDTSVMQAKELETGR